VELRPLLRPRVPDLTDWARVRSVAFPGPRLQRYIPPVGEQEMLTPTTPPRRITNRVLGAFTVAGLLGLGILAMTLMIGFEEADSTLLLVSAVLTFAAPIAMLVHLALTREMTRQEKRIWVQGLTGPRFLLVFSRYLTADDRRAAAMMLAEETSARRRA
jgi:hypothetical protein